MGKSVLIADDEQDILDLLDYSLKKEGYEVIKATNGREAFELAKEKHPEIIILDIMMPEIDGIEVCKKLRETSGFSNTLILILTARGEEYSEIAGFDAGADDYIVKPVKLRSLLRRMQLLENRGKPKEVAGFELGPFLIDRERYTIFKEGAAIHFPRKEFELLYLLISNAGKVVKRERILESVWGKEVVVVDRTIDVHIRRIRKKIGEEWVETVKGIGYKFLNPAGN